MIPVEVPPIFRDALTPLGDWIVVLPIVLPMLGSAVLVTMRRNGALRALVGLLTVAAAIVCSAALLGRVFTQGPLAMTMGSWLPPFGISVAADLIGAGFTLVAGVVTLLVVLHALTDADSDPAFPPMALLLLSGVSGSFLTGDLFNLYVWFEVMLIASFGLMTLGQSRLALDGTVKYGFLNFLATAIFLLSLGLLYGTLGTLNMADIIGRAGGATAAIMLGIGALLMVAFGMKAAAVPLHNWLPASYHAPSPAVSALMAGVLTKVGIYALLRTLLVLLPDVREALEPVLVGAAVVTLLVAPLGAIAETDLRRAVGYLLISGIGAILAGLALGSSLALEGAGLYVVHAMLTMAALYLVAGHIEQRAGTADTTRMGGLFSADLPLAMLFGLLLLANAGIPPFLGFWPKLVLLQAAFADGAATGVLLAAMLVLNTFLTLVAVSRLWSFVAWKPAATTTLLMVQKRGQITAAALMTLLVVTAGLWPNVLFEVLGRGAAEWFEPSGYIAAVGLVGGPS